MTFALLKPSLAMLPGYVDALERGWSPDNVRGRAAAEEQLARIAEDPAGFVESLDDPEARGGPIQQPDGSFMPRLPGYHRWMWDGEFCGSIGFRWAPGTDALPPHVYGHIGYAVPEWKRGRGYATRALGLLLPEARMVGLTAVMLTTDYDNLASQKTITANGGELVDEFFIEGNPHAGRKFRYRIAL
jgi:predicted acetyltransferase